MRRAMRSSVLHVLGRLARPSQRACVRFFYGHGFGGRRPQQSDIANFRSMLRLLSNWYELVSMTDAVRLLKEPEDGRFLCLSFDDGLRDNQTTIAPILADAGATACFFVVTGLLGDDQARRRAILTRQLRLPEDTETLDWAGVVALHRSGFAIGAHTADHLDLGTLSDDAAVTQALSAKREIEARLMAPCDFFAWPYGRVQHFRESLVPLLAPSFQAMFSAIRSGDATGYHGAVIHRDHFEPTWPVAHVRYFAGRTVRMPRRSEALAPVSRLS